LKFFYVIKQQLISLIPPLENYVAVNVDGSVQRNLGVVGFGGLIQHSFFKWISRFYGYVGVSNNILVELLAIFYGLSLAWDSGYRNVSYFLDCLEAIGLVLVYRSDFHRYQSIVVAILQFYFTIYMSLYMSLYMLEFFFSILYIEYIFSIIKKIFDILNVCHYVLSVSTHVDPKTYKEAVALLCL
jgi:hypothetical protein